MLSHVTLSGAELLAYLNVAAKMTAGSSAFAHFASVNLVIEGGAVKPAIVKGALFDPTQSYRLALNSFQANGGDGYPKLTGHPGYVNTSFVNADVMRECLSKNNIKTAGFALGDAVVRRQCYSGIASVWNVCV